MNSKEMESKIRYLQRRDDTIAEWISEMYHDIEWNANAQERKIVAMEKEISILKYITKTQMDAIRELQTEDEQIISRLETKTRDNIAFLAETIIEIRKVIDELLTEDDNLPIPETIQWQVRTSKIVHTSDCEDATNIIRGRFYYWAPITLYRISANTVCGECVSKPHPTCPK